MMIPGAISGRRAAAMSAMFAAGAMATVWFGMGDVSESQGYMSMFRPPQIPRPLELATTAGLTGVMAAKFVAVRRSRVRGLLAMSLLAACLGAFVGLTLRVLSSLTVGANIGGGLLLLASPFVLGPLAVATAICGGLASRQGKDAQAG